MNADRIPQNFVEIEVRVPELGHLFDAIDPSPIRERDLDPRIDEFIVDWSRDAPRKAPLALLLLVDGREGRAEDAALVVEAVHRYFAERARSSGRQLKRLLSVGRTSLLIGIAALALFTVAAELIGTRAAGGGLGEMLKESLSIGGWVAMWRPLQVFLYDWWPIRADAKLFDRLAVMPIRIRYGQ